MKPKATVRVLRGRKVQLVAPEQVRGGDIICDAHGVPLRDKQRRRSSA